MKKIILIIIALVIVGGGAFYGGMKYGQSKNPLGNFSRQDFQNLSSEERQKLFEGSAGEAFQGSNERKGGAGFLSGEVISKDEESLTIKMPDNSSKIVFLSASTTVSKMTDGLIKDIEVGKQIMVSGTQNSDGSYSASNVQIR